MRLITLVIQKTMPRLYSQEGKTADEIMVRVKFFNPTGAGTWYMTEYDPVNRIGYGWCTLGMGPGCDELGTFSIDELQAFTGRLGIGIERDLYWEPVPLQAVMDGSVT